MEEGNYSSMGCDRAMACELVGEGVYVCAPMVVEVGICIYRLVEKEICICRLVVEGEDFRICMFVMVETCTSYILEVEVGERCICVWVVVESCIYTQEEGMYTYT